MGHLRNLNQLARGDSCSLAGWLAGRGASVPWWGLGAMLETRGQLLPLISPLLPRSLEQIGLWSGPCPGAAPGHVFGACSITPSVWPERWGEKKAMGGFCDHKPIMITPLPSTEHYSSDLAR